MPRKRAVAIEETTTVTQRVTLTDEDTAPVIWAAGSAHPLSSAAEIRNAPQVWNAQRAAQRQQALGLLAMWDASAPPGEPAPEWLVRQAVNILRALPGATPLELTLGRSA